LYLDENGDYPLTDISFGLTTDGGEYYQSLGNSETVTRGIITTAYTGLGLPWYSWNQLVNLIYRSSENVANSLVCSGPSNTPEPGCKLTENCASYTDLWDYNLKILFNDGVDIVTNVPIGVFAEDDLASSTCKLHINALNQTDE